MQWIHRLADLSPGQQCEGISRQKSSCMDLTAAAQVAALSPLCELGSLRHPKQAHGLSVHLGVSCLVTDVGLKMSQSVSEPLCLDKCHQLRPRSGLCLSGW